MRDNALDTTTEFIKSYLVLKKAARRNSPNFTEQLCEFITKEFHFYSVLLLKVIDNKQFRVLGKSSASKNSLKLNDVLSCSNCENLSDGKLSGQLTINPKCEIRSTDFMIYEGCFLVKVTVEEEYLVKVAKKSAFSESEKEAFPAISEILQDILELWSGKLPTAGKNFSEFVASLEEVYHMPVEQIAGSYALLKNENLSEIAREHIESIRDNNRYIQVLHADLIELAELESGLLKPAMESVSIKESIDRAVSALSSAAGFVCEVDLDSSVPEGMQTDRKIFQSLLTNVIRFLASDNNARKLEFRVTRPLVKQVQVTATNKNFVLQRDALHECAIGDLIVNVSGSDKHSSPLSLRLAYEYTKLLKGTFECSSTQEDGTTLNVIFDLHAVDDLQRKIDTLQSQDLKNRVLLVVDDYATSKLLNSVFKQLGYDVTTINSGTKALLLLKEEAFHAIVIDVVLPDVSAPEFIIETRMAFETAQTKIIIAKVDEGNNKIALLKDFEFIGLSVFEQTLTKKFELLKEQGYQKVICYNSITDCDQTLKIAEKVGLESQNITNADELPTLAHSKARLIFVVVVDDQEAIFRVLGSLSSERIINNAFLLVCKEEINDVCLSHFDVFMNSLIENSGIPFDQINQRIQEFIPTSSKQEDVEQEEAKIPNILLVEDYKHSQIIVTRLLKKNGFPQITIKENGAEAIEEVKRTKYDLILMDMQMPVMNGFVATEKIREMDEYKETPIIALTAFAMKGDREKCINAGATDYIPKPIDSTDFIEKVKHYTGKQ